MNTVTVIAIMVIAAILYFSIRYIYKERKKGSVCIGCPYADCCPKRRQAENVECGNTKSQDLNRRCKNEIAGLSGRDFVFGEIGDFFIAVFFYLRTNKLLAKMLTPKESRLF